MLVFGSEMRHDSWHELLVVFVFFKELFLKSISKLVLGA